MCSAINRAIGEVALHLIYPLYRESRVSQHHSTSQENRSTGSRVRKWLEAETDLEPGVLLKLQFLIEF